MLYKKWNKKWTRVRKINNLKTPCSICCFHNRSSCKLEVYYCSLPNKNKKVCQRMNRNLKTISLAPKTTNIL